MAKVRIVSKTLEYLAALLGLWLIIGVSAFSHGGAIWVAFATAIALAAVATADAVLGFVQRRWLTPGLAIATVLLAGFLIAASLEFRNASLRWLMAIAGGTIELTALTAMALPRLRVVRRVPERLDELSRVEAEPLSFQAPSPVPEPAPAPEREAPAAAAVAAQVPSPPAVRERRPAAAASGLPLGVALGGGTLAPLVSAAPWLLLGTACLLTGNLLLGRRR